MENIKNKIFKYDSNLQEFYYEIIDKDDNKTQEYDWLTDRIKKFNLPEGRIETELKNLNEELSEYYNKILEDDLDNKKMYGLLKNKRESLLHYLIESLEKSNTKEISEPKNNEDINKTEQKTEEKNVKEKLNEAIEKNKEPSIVNNGTNDIKLQSSKSTETKIDYNKLFSEDEEINDSGDNSNKMIKDDNDDNLDNKITISTNKKEEGKDKKPKNESLHTSDAISQSYTDSFTKKLSNLSDEDILNNLNTLGNEIKIHDDPTYKETYEKSKNNPLTNHRTSKVRAYASGYIVELGAYNSSNLMNLFGHFTKHLETFVKKDPYSDNIVENENTIAKDEAIYKSLYSKIISFSCHPMTYSEFISKTYEADIEALLFGAYSATFPGDNPYQIKCPNCGNVQEININNKKLVWQLNNLIGNSKDIQKFNEISEKNGVITPIEDVVRECRYASAVSKTEIKIVLPISKIVIVFGCPTIEKSLNAHKAFVEVKKEKRIDERNIIPESEIEKLIMLKTIKYIYIPTKAKNMDGEDVVRYPVTDNTFEIVKIIEKIQTEDYAHIMNSAEVRNILALSTISRIFIPNVKCINKNCGTIIERQWLDINDIFFFLIMTSIRSTME